MPIAHRTEVIAHRGASAHAPESTLESFALALRLGADCLELAVRASADGVPVVIHDPTLEHTTGIPRAVAETTSAELGALPAACRPPTLDDVLDAFGPGTGYLIEVKRIPVATESVVLDALAMRGLEDHATIQSFGHLLLRRLRRRDPGVRLAALFRPAAAQVDAPLMERARAVIGRAERGNRAGVAATSALAAGRQARMAATSPA